MPMRTSEVRKLAFRVAVEMYEGAAGNLQFETFKAADYLERMGENSPDVAAAVSLYLASCGVVKIPYLGELTVQFTREGISAIEASLDRPDQPQGPFPAYNVVIGDVAAGAQIALGHGMYNQTQMHTHSAEGVMQLLTLLQGAMPAWPEAEQQAVATVRTLLQGEASNPKPDGELVKAAAKKIGGVALKVGETAGTQMLLAWLKAHGYL